MHKSITVDRVMEAAQRAETTLDNPGFCTACGEEADSCEPDARWYECESCGKHSVFGAMELLFHMDSTNTQIGNPEPTETEQGLTPIPEGYREA